MPAGAPYSLRTEHRTNPIPLDVAAPRLSWLLSDDRPGARQTACQVLVATDPASLEAGQGDLWDSGKLDTDQSVLLPYAGRAVPAGTAAWWKVRTWDAEGKPSPWSEPATWETGLPEQSDWSATWITTDLVGGHYSTAPAPLLRKRFTLGKPVRRARLYITALGLHDTTLNGKPVTEVFFLPGWTEYTKRLQYHAFDVTDKLQQGDNTIAVILGDGWYCGHVGWNPRQLYGERPHLLAQLVVDHPDGSNTLIVTDDTWQYRPSHVVENDTVMGEAHDARLTVPEAEISGPGQGAWTPCRLSAFDGQDTFVPNPTSPPGPPVRRVMTIEPIADPSPAKGLWGTACHVFDLGQNMVGYARLHVTAPAGTTFRLRFAEMLNPDGSLYTVNLRRARATDHYTCRGDADGETFDPHFTFHGFRYVEVSVVRSADPDYTFKPTRQTISGVVLMSDTPVIGEFNCSDPLLNQLQHNIQWGQRGNFLEVPTDCPQRDERLGWTGDAQVFIRTATFNMDVAAFFTKWQHDLADAQRPEGSIPSVAPDALRETRTRDGGPAWSDAVVICPWIIHRTTGDTRLLEQHFDSFARFLNDLEQRSKDLIRSHPDLTNQWLGYGDWLAQDGTTNNFGLTPKDLIGTAYLAYCARLVARMATTLSRPADAARYNDLADRVRAAFQRRYITPAGLVLGQTQTCYVLALHFDLVPENIRPVVVDQLAADIRKHGNRLTTGFVGSSYLPHVLSNHGQLEVAYDLLFRKEWPSWLYAVTQGATTIWERWDGWTHDCGFQNPGMNSFNHYAYGAIGEWLYTTVAGLDLDPTVPGYKRLRIAPKPDPKNRLDHAHASLQTPFGKAESSWRIDAGKFHLDVTVPPNTTASVQLPDNSAAQDVSAGKHTFTCKW